MEEEEGTALLRGGGGGGGRGDHGTGWGRVNEEAGAREDEDAEPLLELKNAGSVQVLEGQYQRAKGMSFKEALANFIKGNTGPGFLSLPFAFANGGYVVGPICLAFIAAICVYCMLLLIKIKNILCAKHGLRDITFGKVAHMVLGRFGRFAVNVSLIVTQLGFCCVYIILISQHINEFSDQFSYQVYALLVAPVFVLLSWVKTYKTIAFASTFANVLFAYSCAVIFAYYFQHMHGELPAGPDCPLSSNSDDDSGRCLSAPRAVAWAGMARLPVFFGSTIFTFEAIGLVLPMESQMRRPSAFPNVILSGLVLVVLLAIAFAIGGYMLFGAAVQGSITLNLPSNALFGSVKVGLSLAFLQSFPVQFIPAIDVIEETTQPLLRARISSPSLRLAARNGIRTAIVAILVALSVAIPHLGLVISLIGSLGCGVLALVLPALMHLVTVPALPLWSKAFDVFIILLGVVGSILGIIVSLKQLIAAS